MGKFQALKILKIATFSCYGLVLIYSLARILDWSAFVVFLTLPLTIRTLREFSQHVPVSADTKISKISFLFSLLLLFSLISEKFLKVDF